MRRKRLPRFAACLVPLAAGCSTPPRPLLEVPPPRLAAAPTPTPRPPVVQVSAAEPAAPNGELATAGVLTVDSLIAQVLARNPTLAQMVAAAAAAAARPAQVTSLDDPTLGLGAAPAAVGQLGDGNRGYRIDYAQRLPWPGKLELRGTRAEAAARAAGRDVDDTKLRLIENTRSAFYDYYLAARALEVNAESRKLLKEFRDNAESRYATGQAPQQDILQAEVELGRERERQLGLERGREIAAARINTLMHLPTDSPLAPPPKELNPAGLPPATPELQQAALANRPDLKAQVERVAAEQAALALAHKEFYPDFRLVGSYNTFLAAKRLYPQVSLDVNLPVRRERRFAAVAEAQATLTRRIAELQVIADRIGLEVETAGARLRESERAVRLYDADILPAATKSVQSAQSAYVTGKVPFVTLLDAQRTAVSLRDRYYAVVADYFRRAAELERAVGGPVPLGSRKPPAKATPAEVPKAEPGVPPPGDDVQWKAVPRSQ